MRMRRLSAAVLAFAMVVPAVARAQTPTVVAVPIIDANHATRQYQFLQFPNGYVGPSQIVTSPLTGQPYNMIGGMPTAPSIAAGYPVSRSQALTTAGTAYTVMAAASSTPRKAGYCQASFSNHGVVGLSITGTAATPPSIANDVELQPGQPFDLNQHGYAEQGAVTAVSTASGDILLCQEVQ